MHKTFASFMTGLLILSVIFGCRPPQASVGTPEENSVPPVMTQDAPVVSEPMTPVVTEEVTVDDNSVDITITLISIENRFIDLYDILDTYKLREAVPSPSGRKVLFSGGEDDNSQDVYLYDLTTGEITLITPSWIRSSATGPHIANLDDAAWSPDETLIAFSVDYWWSANPHDDTTLCAVNIDTGWHACLPLNTALWDDYEEPAFDTENRLYFTNYTRGAELFRWFLDENRVQQISAWDQEHWYPIKVGDYMVTLSGSGKASNLSFFYNRDPRQIQRTVYDIESATVAGNGNIYATALHGSTRENCIWEITPTAEICLEAHYDEQYARAIMADENGEWFAFMNATGSGYTLCSRTECTLYDQQEPKSFPAGFLNYNGQTMLLIRSNETGFLKLVYVADL